MLKALRFHGRGGQGVVLAAEIMAMAAVSSGKYCTALPAFGAERRGMPVAAFLRISDAEIKERCQVREPDCVLAFDKAILSMANIFAGLKGGGSILLNASSPPKGPSLPAQAATVAIVDATKIAIECLGEPIPNSAMLGGLAAISDILDPESIAKSIEKRLPGAKAKGNAEAFWRAFKEAEIISGGN